MVALAACVASFAARLSQPHTPCRHRRRRRRRRSGSGVFVWKKTLFLFTCTRAFLLLPPTLLGQPPPLLSFYSYCDSTVTPMENPPVRLDVTESTVS
jgi:hypothetical protein